MRRMVTGALVAAVLAGSAEAQEISAEADALLWCDAMLQALQVNGAFPDLPFHEAVLASLAIFEAPKAAEAELADMGLEDGERAAIRQSYADEAEVQASDYRVNGADGLRLPLGPCLALGGETMQ